MPSAAERDVRTPQPPLTDDEYQAVCAGLADLLAHDVTPPVPPVGPSSLLALDVDGTIMAMDCTVSSRMSAVLARAVDSGTHVVIATGRGVAAAMPVARACGLTRGWMVCANGAHTIRLDPDLPGGYETVSTVTFEPREVIKTLARALPDAIVAVESDDGFLVSRPFPEGELIESQRVVDFEQLWQSPVTRVVVRAPGMDIDAFTQAIANSGVHSVEYAVGWTAWLDVAPQGVTKAGALAALCERLGIEHAHTMAVGDGTNDIEMLRWANLSAAMGNAIDSVRHSATIVTETVWHDGCAAFLDAWLDGSAHDQGAEHRP